MPSIKPFESKVDAPGPAPREQASPDAFGAAQAEAQSRFAQTLGQAGDAAVKTADYFQKQTGISEVSDLTVKLAQTQSDYTKKWQEQLKSGDPGDLEMAQNFMQEYDDNASDTRDSIKTREGQLHFDKANAVLRQHFTDTANAGQAEMVGVKAQADFTNARQMRMDTLAADPGSYWTSKELQNQDVDNLIGKIPRNKVEEERITSRKLLADAAVRGQILIDPKTAMAQLEGGKWDTEIDSANKFHLLSESRAAIRMNRTDELLAAQAAAQALQATQDKFKNQFLNQIHDPSDPHGALTWKQISKSPLDPGDKQTYYKILEAGAENGENPKNPALFNDAMRRIGLPDGDPEKLNDDRIPLQWVAQGKMPYGDAIKVRTEIQGKKSDQGQMEASQKADFLKNVAAPSILKDNPVAGLIDKDSHDRLYRLQYEMDAREKAQRAANKPIADLYNPESPDYLGTLVPKYQKTLQEGINTLSQSYSAQKAAPPGAAQSTTKQKIPRKAGETPQQYLDRISK